MKLSQAKYVELYRLNTTENSQKIGKKILRVNFQKFNGKVFDMENELDLKWIIHEIRKGWQPYAVGTNPLINSPLEIEDEYFSEESLNIHEHLDSFGCKLSESLVKIFEKYAVKTRQDIKSDIIQKETKKTFSIAIIQLSEKYAKGEKIPKLLIPDVEEYLSKNNDETDNDNTNGSE